MKMSPKVNGYLTKPIHSTKICTFKQTMLFYATTALISGVLVP